MNEDGQKALRELLGDNYSDVELEDILREFPELAEQAVAMLRQLRQAKEEPIPELSLNFTAQLMAKLEAPSWWRRFRETWLSVPRLALASGVAAVLVAGLWWGAFRHETSFPGLSVREALGPDRQKIYFVRFAIKQPGAKQVAVAGDFNQWNAAVLSPSPNEPGLFTIEVPLVEGSYSYAFVIDGRRWIADASADRVVDDGFGQRNSVINL